MRGGMRAASGYRLLMAGSSHRGLPRDSPQCDALLTFVAPDSMRTTPAEGCLPALRTSCHSSTVMGVQSGWRKPIRTGRGRIGNACAVELESAADARREQTAKAPVVGLAAQSEPSCHHAGASRPAAGQDDLIALDTFTTLLINSGLLSCPGALAASPTREYSRMAHATNPSPHIRV